MDVTPASAALAVISAMITPALLILASGSLVAFALMRLARSVDRMRVLLTKVENDAPYARAKGELLQRWLKRHERRSFVAERAIALFFAAVACFVVDSLSIAVDRFFDGSLAWLPIGLTVLGMFLILGGAAYMLQECRLGGEQVRDEISFGSISVRDEVCLTDRVGHEARLPFSGAVDHRTGRRNRPWCQRRLPPSHEDGAM